MAILMVCAATWSMCEPKWQITERQCETIITIPSPGKMYCVMENGLLKWRPEDEQTEQRAVSENLP